MTEKPYITRVLENKLITTFGSMEAGPVNCLSLRLRISKGFRHQIRCHLAWLGRPILNDALYGGMAFGNGCLALRACSLAFADPATGEERCYSISGLAIDDFKD
jgi:23S rRNA pseudouridine1911/1915/1917 synthase